MMGDVGWDTVSKFMKMVFMVSVSMICFSAVLNGTKKFCIQRIKLNVA